MNHPVQLSNVKSFITTRIVPHTSSINATRHSFKHPVRPCLDEFTIQARQPQHPWQQRHIR
jgi:hypothetical protein